MKIIYILLLLCSGLLIGQQIPDDKKLHYGAGVITGGLGYAIILHETGDKKKAFIGGVLTSVLAGVGKEYLDSTDPKNRFDKKDLAATVLGGLSINITVSLFNRKKKGKELKRKNYEKNLK